MHPQGGEKILVYNLLGHIIPERQVPIDVGAVIHQLHHPGHHHPHYIRTGMPLVERCVTVDTLRRPQPATSSPPIGTP